MSTSLKEKISANGSIKLPDTPGVYFFLGPKDDDDTTHHILYIGKATSLKDRVRSYFAQDMLVTRGPKIVRMLELAQDIQWQETDSVLEALLLEAQLIKKHQPPYNTAIKDDKSFNYIVITKEAFPRVLQVRERDKEKLTDLRIKHEFGPFTQGGSLKEALKIIRRIFPYRDTCTPYDASIKVSTIRSKQLVARKIDERKSVNQSAVSPRPCFNAQIGLCPGVCAGTVTREEYAKTVRNIKLFFEGKKSRVVRYLEKEMLDYAKYQEFEKAQTLKRTIFSLNHIQDVSLLKKNVGDYDDVSRIESGTVFRIEAYDIAHLSGKNVVGVMTVTENGVPRKDQYRKFKLSLERNDDVHNLQEILTRRLKHEEWPMADLIAVDGFELQINMAKHVLSMANKDISVVGVVKDEHHNPKDILGQTATEIQFAKHHKDAILLANNEAHRFAITFHRKRRSKNFIKK